MSYYKLLGCQREPFSTSPDPHFFFLSAAHKSALYRLRIALRLRRGISLVLGDVGTGKTTLSRRLVQVASHDAPVEFHPILNPYFESEVEFLAALLERFQLPVPDHMSVRTGLATVERYLFRQAVEAGHSVVLIIDEAQRLSPASLEVLRALLNYETNDAKLLQIVLLAQLELLPAIRACRPVWDRVGLKYVINPLDEAETREMIAFRLQQAGYAGHAPMFSDGAIAAIYEHTQGYPRRVAAVCHDALEHLVMHNMSTVTPDLIRELAARDAALVQVETSMVPSPTTAHAA